MNLVVDGTRWTLTCIETTAAGYRLHAQRDFNAPPARGRGVGGLIPDRVPLVRTVQGVGTDWATALAHVVEQARVLLGEQAAKKPNGKVQPRRKRGTPPAYH